MPAKRILLLGDVCAKPGRLAVVQALPELRRELGLDFVVVNAENTANGYGITPAIARELLAAGADCLTLGDHFLDRKEIAPYLDSEHRILRPLNYPVGVPGHGSWVFELGDWRIGVISLQGRVYLKAIDCPFQTVVPEIARMRALTPAILVDFHAEATAEKLSLGWYLDGEVSAVLGTHTHVVTADERVLSRGTAYITDIGMCGGLDSVLGMRRDLAIKRMMQSTPLRLEPARENLQLQGVVVEVDPKSGRAASIRRLARAVKLREDAKATGPEANTGSDRCPEDSMT
jgi:metallophosphoesterase (TIGR00282 family)